MGPDTSDVKESVNNCVDAVLDAMRYIGDASYAVLPRDVAHSLGDLKKSFLNVLRTAVDKEIEWIDERVAGGDRMREEWREACETNRTEGTGEPINYGSPTS
jgi:hypothetical protein